MRLVLACVEIALRPAAALGHVIAKFGLPSRAIIFIAHRYRWQPVQTRSFCSTVARSLNVAQHARTIPAGARAVRSAEGAQQQPRAGAAGVTHQAGACNHRPALLGDQLEGSSGT